MIVRLEGACVQYLEGAPRRAGVRAVEVDGEDLVAVLGVEGSGRGVGWLRVETMARAFEGFAFPMDGWYLMYCGQRT